MLHYEGAGPVPANGPTSAIVRWQSYVLGRWPGGVDLGAWNVRNVRGGNSLSLHAVGRAWDWRYQNPGPGRAAAEEAMAFTVQHHELLGIQAIHDYVARRIWRSSRGDQGPAWRLQPPGNGMGAAWALWLHFEVHPTSALHSRTVEELLGAAPVAVVPTASLPLPELRPGSVGQGVAHLQHVLSFWRYYTATIDGRYGPKTAAAVKAWQVNLQPFNVGRPDGVYGHRTHAGAAASYAALAAFRPAA